MFLKSLVYSELPKENRLYREGMSSSLWDIRTFAQGKCKRVIHWYLQIKKFSQMILLFIWTLKSHFWSLLQKLTHLQIELLFYSFSLNAASVLGFSQIKQFYFSSSPICFEKYWKWLKTYHYWHFWTKDESIKKIHVISLKYLKI